MSYFAQNLACGLAICIGVFTLGNLASAADILPYEADANTLHLYHFDEASGDLGDTGSSATSIPLDWNSGSHGQSAFDGFGNSYLVDDGHYAATGWGRGGSMETGSDGVAKFPDSEFQSATGAFTFDAMIKTSTITHNETQYILSQLFDDGDDGGKGWDFGIDTGGNLLFDPRTGGTVASQAIPTSGEDAFDAGEWFHVAVTHDGEGEVKLYWTRVRADAQQANLIGTLTGIDDMDGGTHFLYVGSNARLSWGTGYRNELQGVIDEVRISDTVRTADDFIFQIPEPSSLLLLCAGLTALLGRRRRRA